MSSGTKPCYIKLSSVGPMYKHLGCGMVAEAAGVAAIHWKASTCGAPQSVWSSPASHPAEAQGLPGDASGPARSPLGWLLVAAAHHQSPVTTGMG